jgi:Ca2+-transporting ATPase
VLIEKSCGILMDNRVDSTVDTKSQFIKTVENYAEEALRTLAVGQKELSEDEAFNGTIEELETELVLTGVAGIIDPARDEVKESVKMLQGANVEVVMITGDHEKTAKAIALNWGIIKAKSAPIIKGIEIEKMTEKAWSNCSYDRRRSE